MTTVNQDFKTPGPWVAWPADHLDSLLDTLTMARLRQEEMLAEVRRRLAAVAAEERVVEDKVFQTEREACELEVHAAMPQYRGAEADAATELRRTALDHLDGLVDADTALHTREQRLRRLERALGGRIEDLNDMICVLTAARPGHSVQDLVDFELDGNEGCAEEDEGYEADF